MPEEKKDPEVIVMPEAQAEIDANPELAEMVRNFSASARQAMTDVQNGKYANFADAMEAITGHRPEPVDDLDVDGLTDLLDDLPDDDDG